MMAEIELQHRRCGLKYFAVLMSIQPQGREPREKVSGYAEQFRALKACQRERGLRLGILLQQTIGHNATWNPFFDQELDWQRTIRNTGERTVRFCPMGSEFRKYVSWAVEVLAQEHPEFLIVDDDARLDTRADKGYFECFCPRHTALFNERYGTHYTSEEFREAVNSAPDHAPLLGQFTEFATETMADYMRLLRQSADRAAPGIPMILCGNAADAGKKGAWAKLLAGGRHPAMMRIGNGYYLENAPRVLTQRFALTAVQKFLEPSDVLLLDEADTCPHNCYSKSARTMHLHITTGLLNGLDGAKLWISDTWRHNPRITAPYAGGLAKYRRFYSALHQSVRQVAWQGPLVNLPRLHALPRPHLVKWWRHGMWATSYLSLFGLPFRYGTADASGLHLLSGKDPDCFSDAELARMLSESALLDSCAAKKLLARGFGEQLGLREIQELTHPVQGEEIISSQQFLRGPREGDSVLVPLPQAQVLTRFLLFGAEPVPGAVRSRNVIVTAWRVDWDCRIDLHPDRKALLTYLLRQLQGGVPARFESASDASLWYGHGRDFDLAAVANYGYDPLEELLLELRERPQAIQQLLPDGGWQEVSFVEEDGLYRLPVRLECAETAVFKLLGTTPP